MRWNLLAPIQAKASAATQELVEETRWQGWRLVVAHDPQHAQEQTLWRRERIATLQEQAQAAKAAKAAFLACPEPALYGLNIVLDALITLRDVLESVGSALRAGLSRRPMALPVIAAVDRWWN